MIIGLARGILIIAEQGMIIDSVLNALAMPVLAPLGDLVDINREAVVTAYQFGNGLTNLISPTGGVLLAGLAIAQISFGQWLKVIFKLFPILWLVAVIFAAISAAVGI
ncbi:hypothetical protein [Paenibacillus terrae]|uniref:hypothetical protein n=1 Tax=Paenibacillus terrae TaxID=159743 RepID=UPI0021CCD705|nr:hypothetical protein [Paenibacillus terrae]